MRKKLLLIFTSLISILIVNCSIDNEDNYVAKTDFKFPFTVQSDKSAVFYVNDKGYISLTPNVTKAAKIAKLDYKISVKTNNAGSMVVYDKDKVLKQGELQPWALDRFYFLFKKPGKHELIFEIQNQYGYTLQYKETIEVQEIDFLVSLNSTEATHPLINKPFILDILPKEEDSIVKEDAVGKELTYKFSYDIKSLNNEKVEVFYNSRKLTAKETVNYLGKEMTMKFPKTGEYELTFSVISSQGKKIEKREYIFVEDVKFDFNFFTENKTYPTIKKLFKIKAEDITEDIYQKYTFKYEISSSKKPEIYYNNNILNVSRDIVYSGEDIYITFPETGQYDFKISMQNQYGYVLAKDFFYNINYANFEVDLKEIPKELFLSQQYEILVKPKLTAAVENEENITYQLKVKYNTNDLRVLYDDYNLSPDNYSKYSRNRLRLIPLKESNTEVTIYLKNNQGLEVSQKIILNQKQLKFDFALDIPRKIFPNTDTTIKLKLKEETKVKNIDYKIKIKSTNSKFSVNYNNSKLVLDYEYPFNPDLKDFNFNFQESGSYVVAFIISNNYGSKEERIANIDVTDTSYEIRVEKPSTIYPNTSVVFNYVAVENMPSTYRYRYNISDGIGQIVEVRQQGKYQYPNEWINYVNKPYFFKFPKAGMYILNLEFENKYGKKITTRQNIRVESPTYTVSISGDRKVDQNAELSFNIDINKTPTDQEIVFSVTANKKESISYIKYNNRKISLGDEMVFDPKNLVIGFSEPNDVQLSFQFKNENNVRVTKNFDIVVKPIDYQTEINALIADQRIGGYENIFFFNPVNLSVNVSSKLQINQFQMRITNPYLLNINSVISPNSWFKLTANQNNFSLHFDNAIYGSVRNSVKIEIKDIYGKVAEKTINVPVNKKPDEIIFIDFDDTKIVWDKTRRNKGYRVNSLVIKPFRIKSKITPTKVKALINIAGRDYEFEAQGIGRLTDDTFEVKIYPEISFYERKHNNDKGNIIIEATDNYSQNATIKVFTQIP